jgi:hypothetical protein
MIKLTKTDEPPHLAHHAAEWTAVLLQRLSAGERPTDAERSKYRHPHVKAALVAETSGKCAYCESKLLHIHHGDVEHIYPKSLDILRSFDWTNLTLACEKCNGLKSDRDPLAQFIIDPYDKDPEQHMFFVGPFIFSRGSLDGTSTRAILELFRAELVETRTYHLSRVMGIYDKVLDTAIPAPARQALYNDLKATEAAGSAQYAAMVRCLIADMVSKLPADIVP